MNPTWFTSPLHTRAPKGGEVDPLNGRQYKGGEIEPFYVPRSVMPQIDDAKYGELIQFASVQGIKFFEELVAPESLHPHQRIDKLKVKHMEQNPEALAKRLLVSADDYILDGNHRWLGHWLLKTPAPIYRVNRGFEEAIAFLFSFPGCYCYGDGAVHPVTY